jgi:hypothetical protein
VDESNFMEKQAGKLVPPHVVSGIRCPTMLAGVLKSAYVKHKKLAHGSVFRNNEEIRKRNSDLHSAIWRKGNRPVRMAPKLRVSIASIVMLTNDLFIH